VGGFAPFVDARRESRKVGRGALEVLEGAFCCSSCLAADDAVGAVRCEDTFAGRVGSL